MEKNNEILVLVYKSKDGRYCLVDLPENFSQLFNILPLSALRDLVKDSDEVFGLDNLMKDEKVL